MMSEAMEVTTAVPGPHRSATPELHAAYTTLEILVAIVAIVGNAMVIHVFRRDRRLRRRTNYYIVSLAVADLLVGLLGIPFAILASVGLPRNLHACLFTVSLLVMLCTISIFCLVGVSVDRYWAILHPMCYSRNVRTKTAIRRQTGDGESALAPSVRFPPNSASRASGPALYVAMKLLHAVFIYFTVTVCVHAKIHGGPRGRFSNHSALRAANSNHVVTRHTHYSYHPPSYISFMCRKCSAPQTYPVFHGQPPTYVYKYRESTSRYAVLLTGLALYNLGRSSKVRYHAQYPDDKCSMQIIYWKHYEETTFPCFMMSTFMERSATVKHDASNVFDITSSQINVKPFINNTGSPIFIQRHQDCVIWHNTTSLHIKNEKIRIPCALLEEYAETMKPTGVPVYIWLPMTLAVVLTIYIFGQCCCRMKKDKTEAVPLNQSAIIGYCSH